jgi:predicted ATPase
MRQGLEAMQTTGAGLNRPYFLAQLAAAYAQAEQYDAGLAAVAEALELVASTGERWWEAELHRLQGVLLLGQKGHDGPIPSHQPTVAQAEACLRQALAIARQQQARALDLRAAMSLGRLWQRQGRREEARRLLAEVYAWFTEGLGTQDLQSARALLQAWAERA